MRKSQGLTMRQLAGLAEVSVAQLSDVENGKQEPSDRWLKSVTDAIGLYMAGQEKAS